LLFLKGTLRITNWCPI